MAMTLHLTDEEQAALAGMAEREGLTQEEVVRRAIRERAERTAGLDAVQSAGRRAVTRYADLLDRLAQ